MFIKQNVNLYWAPFKIWSLSIIEVLSLPELANLKGVINHTQDNIH